MIPSVTDKRRERGAIALKLRFEPKVELPETDSDEDIVERTDLNQTVLNQSGWVPLPIKTRPSTVAVAAKRAKCKTNLAKKRKKG